MSAKRTNRDGALTPPLLLKLVAAGAASFAVVMLLPHTVSGKGDVPPTRMLLETAVLVSLICAAALFWGIRSDLRLPAKVAVYAVLFNVLVIAVKLWLAPHGFYDVNQLRDLGSGLEIDDSFAAVFAAALIFVLYAGVYVVLYRVFRKRIAHLAADPLPRLPGGRAVAIAVVVLILLGFGSGGAILILLLPVFGGLDYLDFVFSSGVSLVIALALAAATAFAAVAFDATAKRVHLLGDATLYMSFFWVGLYFLALYHVLWVVYVLTLTSIWPLKVVTPK